MTNKEKLDEQVKKMKAEKAEGEEKQLAYQEKVKSELAAIQADSEIARMMAEDAQVGAENIKGASLPIMKVTAAGKSSHVLADGTRPTDGYFFYGPTQEEFKDLTVHVLTVSRGFYLAPLESSSNRDPKFCQMICGLFEHPTKGLLPFTMFFQGKKWMVLNEFTKDASSYTRMKPVPVPMFQLTVTLTTHSEDNEKFGGYYHIVDFEIEKSNGIPLIVVGLDLYSKLKNAVSNAEDLLSQYIAANEVQKVENATISKSARVESDEYIPPATDGVATEDIPY